MKKLHIVRPAIGTGLVLLIPLVMTIVDRDKPYGTGWNWGVGSFAVMGLLLFGSGLAYEVLAARLNTRGQKFALAAAIFLGVVCVWAELAVDAVSKALRFLTA